MRPWPSRIAMLLLLATALPAARAQDVPPDEPVPPPIDATEPPPLTMPGSPVLIDPPQLALAYEEAFSLLVREQWDAAATVFDEIVRRTVDPERRGAARELARYAREMDQQQGDGPTRQSGRATFVATSTLASFYAGFVIDDLAGISNYKSETLLITGVTLAGFGGALYGTKGRRVTESMAQAYGSGLLIGVGNGLLFAPILGIEPDADCCDDGEVNQNYLGFGLGVMAAGGALGTYLAYKYDPTPAQAQFSGVMGMNGLMTVGLGMAIVQPDLEVDTILALLGLGLDAGVAGGVVLGRRLTWSKSRLTYVTLGEFLGGLVAGALAVVTADERSGDGELAAGMVLGGLWGGFGLATYLTRDMAPDPRFRKPTVGAPAPQVTLAPMLGERGTRGLSLVGSF